MKYMIKWTAISATDSTNNRMYNTHILSNSTNKNTKASNSKKKIN